MAVGQRAAGQGVRVALSAGALPARPHQDGLCLYEHQQNVGSNHQLRQGCRTTIRA